MQPVDVPCQGEQTPLITYGSKTLQYIVWSSKMDRTGAVQYKAQGLQFMLLETQCDIYTNVVIVHFVLYSNYSMTTKLVSDPHTFSFI
jgi:hypothetical protein